MELKEELLVAAELSAEAFINNHMDAVIEAALVELKKVIPGEIDDLVINTVKETIKAKAKELALSQAEKISDKV